MRKQSLLFIFALSVSACATPNQIRSRGADLNTSSTKPAHDVAICIADKWENSPAFERIGMVNTSIKPNGYTITIMAHIPFVGTHAAILADVQSTGTGCNIAYFSNDPLVIEHHYKKSIAECAL